MRLRTFGGLFVEGPNGRVGGVLAQRRRLALLALLATSERGMSRDRLLGYLWPENGEERARHALAQMLYTIRRELGDALLRSEGPMVSLDPAALASDVADFRRALEHSDAERAAALYEGPFLDGFYLTGCAEFERWVESTRSELASRVQRTLWELGAAASRRGDADSAVVWLTRLSQLAPLDSRIALALMQAHADAGQRVAAIEHGRRHRRAVAAELGTTADPSIDALERALRSPVDVDVDDTPPPTPPAATASPLEPSPHAATYPGGSGDDVPSPALPPGRRRPVGGRRVLLAAAVVAVLITAAEGWRQARAPVEGTRRWVLIADVENATPETAFDRSIPVALAAALTQSAHLYPMPPDRVRDALIRMRRPGADSLLDTSLAREIAQREGVAAIAIPFVERSGEGYDLSVRIVDPVDGGVTALSSVHAARREQVVEALDLLARKVRRSLGEPRLAIAVRSVPLPRVTTRSLDALRHYADGARAWSAQQYDAAVSSWNQAVALDSQFAQAHASLGMLAYWTNRPGAGERHYSRALALRGDLPERERVRIGADFERARGNFEGAVAIAQPYVARHPDDLSLLALLGYAYGRLGRSGDAASIFTRITAIDSLDHESFINLASAQKVAGRYAEAVRSYRRAFALLPSLETANSNTNLEFAQAFVLAGQPDSAEARFAALMASGDALRRARALRSLAFLDLWRGHFAKAGERLAEAVALTRREQAGVSEVRNRLLLAATLDATGRERAVRPLLAAAVEVVRRLDAEPTLLFWTGKALARAGMHREAADVLQLLERAARAEVRGDRAALAALRGEFLLARGRESVAIASLRSAADDDSTSHVLESLAYGLAAADSLDAALDAYGRLARRVEFGWEGQLLSGMTAWNLGRLHEQRGRVPEATREYRRFLARWGGADSALVALADIRLRLHRLAVP